MSIADFLGLTKSDYRYIHISIIHQGQAVPSLWERAGHESQLPSILDKLFYASRNVHLSIWQSGYPTQELVDDFSVFRPLELFNECNKFKLLIRDQQLQSAVDADKLAMELADIGNVSTSDDIHSSMTRSVD